MKPRLLVTLAFLLPTAMPVHAGTLTGATWFQVTEARGANALVAAFPMTRTSAQLGASGASTATSVAVSLSYPAFATTVLALGPQSTQYLAVQVTQGGNQVVTATQGMGGGSPGILGTLIVMTAAHAAMGVNQSMFPIGQHNVLVVPLLHGKAGTFAGTFSAVGLPHGLTVAFYAWTPGTLAFVGLTSFGAPLPDVVAMGSFDLTAKGGGTVTLVSPSKVSIDGPLDQRRTASFATLRLTFVPEPGTLLLLGGAALALVLRARGAPPAPEGGSASVPKRRASLRFGWWG